MNKNKHLKKYFQLKRMIRLTDIFEAYELIRKEIPEVYPIISTNPLGWEKIDISFDILQPKDLRFIAKIASDFNFEIRHFEYGLKLIRVLNHDLHAR